MCTSGGSLMASFETSLYDENLKPRADFGLADLMGVSKNGDVVGTNGNPYSARIETAAGHPILQGFQDTNWLAGAQNRIPLKPADAPLLTVVPGLCPLPSRAGVSAASSHYGAGPRAARDRSQPHRMVSG